MDNESFKLVIYTPAGLLLEEQVRNVSLPSSNGEIGILPQHSRYAGILGTGILSYVKSSESTLQRLVVSGGLCMFANDILTILADSVALADQIDQTTYAKERENFSNSISTLAVFDPAWSEARQKLSKIEAIDKLLIH